MDMTDTNAPHEELPPEIKVDTESIACRGIYYSDLPNIDFVARYDFAKDYPWSIHSPSTQATFKNASNFLEGVTWKVDSGCNFKDTNCNSIIIRDRNNSIEMNNTTTRAYTFAYIHCISLQFNQRLLKVVSRSATKDYVQLPSVLCPLLDAEIHMINLSIDIQSHGLS